MRKFAIETPTNLFVTAAGGTDKETKDGLVPGMGWYKNKYVYTGRINSFEYSKIQAKMRL